MTERSSHQVPTQADAILGHLRTYGSITPLEALNRYGCFRLAARVYELRKRGVGIVVESVRTGGGATVARYSLGTEPPVEGQQELWT